MSVGWRTVCADTAWNVQKYIYRFTKQWIVSYLSDGCVYIFKYNDKTMMAFKIEVLK